ncbi:hypothetical protein CRM22_008878 [Opisthorchis felineus]|uniref:Uncharacterized protein n=1 Tax=Opisthorchis felineus TaxID=147828 RepID=A0A4S2L9T9_OPIFE|nr:hypothetical protein CRM22_008878 [Opisthorchis felineus]
MVYVNKWLFLQQQEKVSDLLDLQDSVSNLAVLSTFSGILKMCAVNNLDCLYKLCMAMLRNIGSSGRQYLFVGLFTELGSWIANVSSPTEVESSVHTNERLENNVSISSCPSSFVFGPNSSSPG